MPSLDVVTFGETMIRLSPPAHGRLEDTATLDMRIGGSESNMAVALSQLGRTVSWWSKLPDNPLGRRIASDIRRRGVDTAHVVWTGSGRVGTYYIEFGTPPRPHSITYDRAGSVASTIEPADFEWRCLEDFRHLHLTGITAALSESCRETVLHAAREAKERGLSVSLDVNYRRKLWPPDRAGQALSEIMPHLDLLLCADGDATEVFGITGDPSKIAEGLRDKYGVRSIVVTAGLTGAVGIHDNSRFSVSAIEALEVDRVGSGDAFDAGVLDGFLDADPERGMKYGVAMAALKRTMPGDELIATRAEIEELLAGAGLGIRR